MSVFVDYAQFYDVLYQEKNYEAECDSLEQIFSRYAKGTIMSILDLGCGTGGHVIPLTRRGYRVTGVDLSEEMLSKAQIKSNAACQSLDKPTFQRGDIRNLALNKTFDAVVSMFAVIGYLTTNDDLQAALRVARKHLQSGGLFIFDVWHGPAVLTERPMDRYKIIEADGERIVRFVHPELDILHHTVDVQYRILRLKDDLVLDEVSEVHTMRFFFPQEIVFHLECAGFRALHLSPFLHLEESLNERDWNLAVVAEAC